MRSTCRISFGNNCSLGWGITFNTSDGHPVWHKGEKQQMEASIEIGDNVWLTPHCSLLKNAQIPDHCIVAQKSVITKRFTEKHCLIGGIPARVVAHGIEWHAKDEYN